MATSAALAGPWCPKALCDSDTSAGGVERSSKIAMRKGAAGGSAVLAHMKCQNQGRKLQPQRRIGRFLATSVVIVSNGRQSLKFTIPAAVSEEAEGAEGIAQAEGPAIEPEETVEEQDVTPNAKVTFRLQKQIHFGQVFNVAGSAPELGQWDIGAAIPLVWSEGHVWTAEVAVPVARMVEYKFVLKDKQGEVYWQPGENKVFNTRDATDLVVSEPWDASEPTPDVSEHTPDVLELTPDVSEPTPDISEGAPAVAAASGNSIAPGADLVESVVAAAGMVAARLEGTAKDVSEKSNDVKNSNSDGEVQTSEVPDISEGAPAVAAASGNSVAPGADLIESAVAAAGMVTARVEGTPKYVSEKATDIKNSNSGGKEEASEVPVVGAILAAAVTKGGEEDDDSAAP